MAAYNNLPELQDGDPIGGPIKWQSGLLYGGRALGIEKISVTSLAVKQFTVPAGAKMAILCVDADQTATDLNKVIHWTEDGTDPTTTSAGNGMLLGDNSVLEIRGSLNVAAFKMISREVKTNVVRVQYYG
jgi:hypothetical protein